MVFEELKVRFTGQDGLSGVLGHMTQRMGIFNKQGMAMGVTFAMINIAVQAMMKAITGLINFVKESIQAYVNFEKGLAEVATLLDDTSVLEGYSEGLRQLAKASGESLDTLTKGLYQVISASVDAGAAMGVLTVANKAAIGGLSDTATSVDAITSIMNAYGYSAAEAERISDYLFTAVKYGKTTFSELASGIGPVITMAANLGVGFDQVAASIATMTRSGIQTTNAVTYLRGAFRSILKPTDQMKEAAKELGIQFDGTALKSKGLGGFLEYVSDAVGTNTEALAKLFPNIRGIQAVMALGGKNAQAFAKDIENMGDSAGATGAAFAKMADTTAFKLARMEAEVKDTQLEIGEKMIPVTLAWNKVLLGLANALNAVSGAVGWVIQKFDEFYKGARKIQNQIREALDLPPITRDFKYFEELDAFMKRTGKSWEEAAKLMEDPITLAIEYPELEDFAASLAETVRNIEAFDDNIEQATDEIRNLSDANVDLLEKIENLTRIKEITDDFQMLSRSTEHAAYAQQIFDNELRNAQIELLKTKDLLNDLNEVVDEYGDITKKNSLAISKIRYKARKEGRELTKEEEKQIEELELANEALRISITEEQIKMDDIQEGALREQEERLEERKRQLEDEEQAIKDKAQTEIERLEEEVQANLTAIQEKKSAIVQWSKDRAAALKTLNDDLLVKRDLFNKEELEKIETQSGLKLDKIASFISKSQQKWREHYNYLNSLAGKDFTGAVAPAPAAPPSARSGLIGPKGFFDPSKVFPQYQGGGYSPRKMLATLHAGEYVLPKKIVNLLDSLIRRPLPITSPIDFPRDRRNLIGSPIGAPIGEGGDIHIYGEMNFYGVQNVEQFMRELELRSRFMGARQG